MSGVHTERIGADNVSEPEIAKLLNFNFSWEDVHATNQMWIILPQAGQSIRPNLASRPQI